MLEHRHRVVIVTPVYEDVPACAMLLRHLGALFGKSLLVVAVDDGSPRAPLRLGDIPADAPDTCILRLRRNVGHQQAIATGLHFIAPQLQPHQRLILMDCDGEDAPASCSMLLAKLESHGDTAIAVAQRAKRSESLKFRAFYVAYKLLFRMSTGRAIDFGNFMVMTPRAAQTLAKSPWLGTHVAAAALASELPLLRVPVDRSTRYHGQSKMNFPRLVRHGMKAILVFSKDCRARAKGAFLLAAALCATLAGGVRVFDFTLHGIMPVIAGVAAVATVLAASMLWMAWLLEHRHKQLPDTSTAAYTGNTQAVLYTP